MRATNEEILGDINEIKLLREERKRVEEKLTKNSYESRGLVSKDIIR